MSHSCETCGTLVQTCKDCGKTKPVDEFYRDRHRWKLACKVCYIEAQLARRSKNIELYRATQRAYMQRPEVREKQRLRMRDTPREVRAAHRAVKAAVTKGVLIRPEACSREKCDNGGMIVGHHWSYDEEHRLDVEFLCRSCHHDEHLRTEQSELAAVAL